MKHIFLSLFLFFSIFIFHFLNPTLILAQGLPQVLLINQVRGQECCEMGSTQNLRTQLDFLTQHQLPAAFSLRFDVLADENFLKEIKSADSELFNWGIFLEITPSLAQAAEVSYQGNEQNWYQAQHAYTLGLEPEDRKRIIDALMQEYYQVFETYPSIVTSWIIDTFTLNYLHDEYGVKVIQITREQWGTDSYTLYGGPPHYPYPASKNWAFIPSFEEARQSGVLVVRQTLTDPVWNYGDTQSRFTSQPNDFSQDGKDFSYFKKLFDQALFSQSSQQQGFALLGLENSMLESYQEVYLQQLELVSKYQQENKIDLPSLESLWSTWSQKQVSLYQGQDLVKNKDFQAFWITAPEYRIRLIRRGSQVLIDDVRLYSHNLVDFYTQHQAQDLSYWIVPFLLDGSRFYEQKQGFWSQKKKIGVGTNPLPDIVTQPQAWKLPRVKETQAELKVTQSSPNSVQVNYLSQQDEMINLDFKLENFVLPLLEESSNLIYKVEDDTAFELVQTCASRSCVYTPFVYPEVFSQAQIKDRKNFLPEQRRGQISQTQSKLYADNPYAVAGRNPVRVVFIPRDEQGLSLKLDSLPKIQTQAKLETDINQISHDEIQFYDFESEFPLETEVVFMVNEFENEEEKLELKTTIYFAPNCRDDFSYCLSHPQQGWWYFKSWVGDKYRFLQRKLVELKNY